MRFVTPTEIEEVAWDGYLEPPGERMRSLEPLPRVTLGEPAWWPAEEALEVETGRAWTPPRPGRRYTLLRLALTLHPPDEPRTTYAEATLRAYLRAAHGHGLTVVAHDLYPRRLTAEQRGTVSVGLGPDLKFGGVAEVSVGQVGAEIEFHRVYPVVQAFGLGEPGPYWQFAHHGTNPLLGCQGVYAVVDAPEEAGGVRLSVELMATLETRRGPLRLKVPEEARAHLSRVVGG